MILLGGRAVVLSEGWLHQFDVASGAERRVQVWEGPPRVDSILGGAGSVVALRLGNSAEAFEILWWDLASEAPVGRLLAQGTNLTVEGTVTAPPAAAAVWAARQPMLAELDLEASRLVMHDLPWLEGTERGCSVAAPSGSRQVLVLDHQGPTVVYDLDRRKVVRQLPVFFPHGATVQAGAGGSLWLVDDLYRSGLVQVDPSTWDVLRRVDYHGPSAMTVDPSGRYAAVRSLRRRTILIVDLLDEVGVWEFEPPERPGSTDGPCLMADGRLIYWSLSAGFEVIAPPDAGLGPRAVPTQPRNKPARPCTITRREDGGMEQLTYHGGGGMILLGDRAVVESEGWLHQFDVASGVEDRIHVGPPGANCLLGGAGSVVAVQLGNSAEALEILWWDLASGRSTGRLLGQGANLIVEGSPIAPPAAVAVWAGRRPMLAALDVELTWLSLRELPWLEPTEGFSVAAPFGSRHALVLDHEGPAAVYALRDRVMIARLPIHFNRNATVQQGADGSLWLVDSLSRGALVQVDASDRHELQRWEFGGPYFLAVDPSGRYGAVRGAGTDTRKVLVVDLLTGEHVSELELPDHPGATRGPCLLSDGRLVYWSAAMGFEIITPTDRGSGHPNPRASGTCLGYSFSTGA